MPRKDVESAIRCLSNINHLDWTKVKIAVDRYFEVKKNELERQLQLVDANDAIRFIP